MFYIFFYLASSPVFGHLAASLQGLTTIRAFKAQTILQKEFDYHQDLHSTAWYLFLASSRTFALWLDTFCIVYLSAVTISFFILGSGEPFDGIIFDTVIFTGAKIMENKIINGTLNSVAYF